MSVHTYYVETEDDSVTLENVIDVQFQIDHRTAVFWHENLTKSIFTNVIKVKPLQDASVNVV